MAGLGGGTGPVFDGTDVAVEVEEVELAPDDVVAGVRDVEPPALRPNVTIETTSAAARTAQATTSNGRRLLIGLELTKRRPSSSVGPGDAQAPGRSVEGAHHVLDTGVVLEPVHRKILAIA